MILVIGRVKTHAERRARLIDMGQRVARTSREEPGCASYRLYEDSATPTTSAGAELHLRESQQPTLGRVPLTAAKQAICTRGGLRDRTVKL